MISQIKTLEVKLAGELAKQIEYAAKLCKELANRVLESNVIKFTNSEPYAGNCKDKIFFTYENHYSANSGVNCSFEKLTHPHEDCDDRGYIKGIATDLSGYVVITEFQKAGKLQKSIGLVFYGKLAKGSNKETVAAFAEMKTDFRLRFESTIDFIFAVENKRINEAFGLSIGYYPSLPYNFLP